MTQHERIPPTSTTATATTTGRASKIGVYDAPETSKKSTTGAPSDVRPTDLIRWGPIFGGLFAALATLITLSILGLAIGLTAFNPGDPLNNFGLGAGIWGAVTALVAFFVGGWIAGRTAAFAGTTSGILTGAMVWFVAIPLLVFLLGGGIGALAGSALQTADPMGALGIPATGQVTGDPAVPPVGTPEGAPGTQPLVTQQTVETARDSAWGVLLSLGLAALAAILGGYAGALPRRETAIRTRA